MAQKKASLKVSALTFDIQWHEPSINFGRIENLIKEQLDPDADILVLPEMFSTGFTMQPDQVAEGMNGSTIQWLQKIARTNDMMVCGSVVINEGVKFFNRFIAVFPDNNISTYDKKYLFTLSGEHETYESGKDPNIFEYKGWKICPRICYDLRFPGWSRNTTNYDLLIYVANWPKPRVKHWDMLLAARAIENQCYVIGVNRIGTDANKLDYCGHTTIYAFDGERIAFDEEKAGIISGVLEKDNMLEYREKLPFLNDQKVN